MLDDFRPKRNKPKRIEPFEAPPQRSIHELAEEHDKMNQPADDIAEPAFQPPEEIASEESAVADVPTTDEPSNTSVHHDTDHHKFLSWRWRLNKKWTLIAAAATAALIFGAGLLAYNSRIQDGGGSFASKRGAYTPKVTTVASNLTGLQVDPSVNQRPVTGIMIENSTDARPQSGLDQAGVVFEAIAEGGITRFLALFQDNQPDYIGPVRSARPYYVQWCMGFDCALAHVGGSPEALSNIKAWGTKDLDQFSNSGGYTRISSRYAPHNVYTSIAKLNQLEAGKKFGTATYTSLPRKKDAVSPTPNATSIDLAVSSAKYNAHFDYDATSNSYKRSEGGAAHMVVNGAGQQTQISPKVVVALVMQYGVASDHHSQYAVTGSGQAFIFQDGTVTAATWSKTDKSAPMTLTGSDNQPVQLNAGQTWFTALSSAGLASYH